MMRLCTAALTIVLLTGAAILSTSCSSSANESSGPSQPTAGTPDTGPGVAPVSQTPPPSGGMQDVGNPPATAEKRKVLAEAHLAQGRAYMEQAQYEKARLEFMAAYNVDSTNRDALEALDRVNAILGNATKTGIPDALHA